MPQNPTVTRIACLLLGWGIIRETGGKREGKIGYNSAGPKPVYTKVSSKRILPVNQAKLNGSSFIKIS